MYVYRYTMDGRHKSQTLSAAQDVQAVPGAFLGSWEVLSRDCPPDGTPKRGDQIRILTPYSRTIRIYEWED